MAQEGTALGAREGRTVVGKNFDYLGVTLYVLRQVQAIYGMSHLLNEAVVAEACPGDRVFDVGTSCGIHRILTTRT
jgi:release factor glutamine methyltransferase